MSCHRTWATVFSIACALGCGARVEGEGPASDAATDASAEEAAAVGTGCPLAVPAGGSSCASIVGIEDEHFYCHYFPKGSSCPIEVKCTNKGAGGTTFLGGGSASSPPCPFTATDCDEGKECGVVFEQSGACIVDCARACHCEPSTGKLACRAVPCP